MSAKARPSTNEKEPTLDLSSMVDVSFLLLVFFLVTSTLDPKESDLGMALPTPDGPPVTGEIDYVTIEIGSNGAITWEEELLDTDVSSRTLPLLDDRLKQYKTASDLLSTQPLVIVDAKDDVPGQRFVDVLNALAKVEIENVTIAGIIK